MSLTPNPKTVRVLIVDDDSDHATTLSLLESVHGLETKSHDEGTYCRPSCAEEIVVPIDLSASSDQKYEEESPVCSHSNVIQKPRPIRQDLRVLLVDDNVDMVTSLAMLLQESGYDVRKLYDGSTVLKTAVDYRPHVVLLDMVLPKLNGFEVASQIRQQPALKNTILVLMSGYAKEHNRLSSQKAGFDHHLIKPVDFTKVREILASVSGAVSHNGGSDHQLDDPARTSTNENCF
jgi:CheY-like chemotaxis protein